MQQKILSVGIDMSLSSTAVTILDGEKTHHLSYLRNKKEDKWQRHFEKTIKYNRYEFKPKEDYSENENAKLEMAEKMTNDIIYDIEDVLQGRVPEIAMEGYAFGAGGNSLIDLVASASLLRVKLKKINNVLQIYAPTALKSWCCRTVYPNNKKLVNAKRQEYTYHNDLGVSGGKFIKHDCLQALLDYSLYSSDFKECLSGVWAPIKLMKDIPKPLDDVTDATFLAMRACEQK